MKSDFSVGLSVFRRVALSRLHHLLFAVSLLIVSATVAKGQVLFGTTVGKGLSGPLGLAFDSSGNLYIGDNGNNRIVKVSLAGVQTTVLSNEFGNNSLAADNHGDLYLPGFGTVDLLPAGASTPTIITCPTTVTSANCPFNTTWGVAGIALDSAGDLYVLYLGEPTDTAANAAVLKIPITDSNCSTPSDCKFFRAGAVVNAADGLYVDASGNIYVAGLDISNNSIVTKISSAGVPSTLPITGLDFSANDTTGMTTDESGDFYISDWIHNRVVELTPSGTQSTVPTISSLLGPAGLAFDSAGNLYIADSGNNRVLVSKPGATAALNFGSVDVTSSSSALTITASFTQGATLNASSIQVLTDGASGLDFKNSGAGTCASETYGALVSCTVSVVFSPTAPGLRRGALVLQDSSGNLLGTEYLYGIGTAPEIAYDTTQPLSQTIQIGGSVLNTPESIAVDGDGNVFVADPGLNEIVRIPATDLTCVTASDCTAVPYHTNLVNPGTGPYGIALDGAGNLYVSIYSLDDVLQITPGGTENYILGDQSAVLYAPSGLAVDAAGNVFIDDLVNAADQNGQVLEVTAGGMQSTVVGDLSSSQFVALDATGNVYVSETTLGSVQKVTPTGVQTTFASGLGQPAGLAVDASGNLYVADQEGNRVLEIASTGVLTSIVTGLTNPRGIALDAQGDLYIAEPGAHTVLKINRSSPPQLAFAATAVGATSSDSPEDVTVINIGNMELTFPIPSTGTNPSISKNFILNSSGNSACPLVSTTASGPGTLAAGADCVLSLSFAPTASGSIAGSLVLTDNQLNATAPGYSTQSISLTGTATNTKLTPTVAVSPSSSSITTAQPLTVTVTVSGGTNNPTPTGSVMLTSGGYASAATTLSSGSATITIPAGSLAAATDTLTVNYTPDMSSSSTYNSATGTDSVTVTVSPNFSLSALPTSVSIAQNGSGTSTISVADLGGFTGTVALAATGLPTGVNASFAAATAAGTQMLTLSASSTATLGGPVTVTVTGTSGSLSATTTVSLTVTAEPTFGPSGSSGSDGTISVAPGATTGNTATIGVAGINGYSGTVNLSCSISPTAASDPATCSLSPASVTLNGSTAQTSTLTVTTTAATTAGNQTKKLFWPSAGGTALALVMLIGVPRRRSWLAMVGLAVLFISIGAIGCGGGGGVGSGGGGGGGGNAGTTAGTYTVTVTGTGTSSGSSSSVTATVGTVTLTVN